MSHPAPEVACREAWPVETPRNAQVLADSARGIGWTAQVTYARGTSMDRRGNPGKVVESIAVRLRRPPLAAVGLWIDDRFQSGWTWEAGGWPHKVSARDLVSYVKAAA